MNRCRTVDFFIPTCHTSACVYYSCRCNYLSLKRSTILCEKNRGKKDDAFAVTVVVWNIMQVLKHQVRKETF